MVGTPHGIVFSRSIHRVPKEDSGDGMLFNSIRGVVNKVQLGCPGCNPTADSRGTVAKTSLHQAISGIGEVRLHRQMYRVPACEIGIEAGGSQRRIPCQDREAHE